jgi:hypothetical protein
LRFSLPRVPSLWCRAWSVVPCRLSHTQPGYLLDRPCRCKVKDSDLSLYKSWTFSLSYRRSISAHSLDPYTSVPIYVEVHRTELYRITRLGNLSVSNPRLRENSTWPSSLFECLRTPFDITVRSGSKVRWQSLMFPIRCILRSSSHVSDVPSLLVFMHSRIAPPALELSSVPLFMFCSLGWSHLSSHLLS